MSSKTGTRRLRRRCREWRGSSSLNRVALVSEVKSYRELDAEARKVGADLVAVYRFETSDRTSDLFVPLTVATLGLAPTNSFNTVATATLMVRDARTGYLYGVLEESATSKGVTAADGCLQRDGAFEAEREERGAGQADGEVAGVLGKRAAEGEVKSVKSVR